jgi:hypothetical protein
MTDSRTAAFSSITLAIALICGVSSCGSPTDELAYQAEPDQGAADMQFDELGEAAGGVDEGPAPAPSGQPAFSPCSGLPAYSSVKLSGANAQASYKRPEGCPGWSGLDVEVTASAAYPYRKLYVTAGFDYVGKPNAKAKCLASKVEWEVSRETVVLGHAVWLPVSQGSNTPTFIDASQICFWHNYNGVSSGTPGTTYHERLRARGVRYDGSIANQFVNARIQSGNLP